VGHISTHPVARKGRAGKIVLFLLAVTFAAAGAYAWAVGVDKARAEAGNVWSFVEHYLPGSHSPTASKPARDTAPAPAWDGFVRIKTDEAKTIGLLVVTVRPQTEPIKLPLMGRTDYDPNTLSKIRPRFDTLVTRVRAERGEVVHQGAPLVDLYSSVLADAKNDFQTAYVQWLHDLNLLKMRENLVVEKANSQQQLIDAQNDERKSRLAYLTAQDKLRIFGVPEEEIEPLLKNLGSGYDVKLMPALNDESSIPRSARNLVVVADVDHVMHFRIFDGDGKRVVDTDQTRLIDKARQIQNLKEQLDSLWSAQELNKVDKDRTTAAVASIVGLALGDPPLPKDLHAISDKAKMTRTSPVAGIVIERNAVTGNLYDNNDVLMVIAPLDHLFVWVNVYEADQAKVAVGQDIDIKFPYLDQTISAKVQYVASEVSKDTRAIMLRASIPNVDRKLKADQLVRAELKIPPIASQTVIPRQSMVVINGIEYAFVQKENKDPDDKYERFERRRLVVAEERDDHVVVKEGLKAGEHVSSNGTLVLSQLYEEQQMIATGMPLK
jgi:multidrug efflux pump subunit AcrA (membrane-fusion protein)